MHKQHKGNTTGNGSPSSTNTDGTDESDDKADLTVAVKDKSDRKADVTTANTEKSDSKTDVTAAVTVEPDSGVATAGTDFEADICTDTESDNEALTVKSAQHSIQSASQLEYVQPSPSSSCSSVPFSSSFSLDDDDTDQPMTQP